AKNLGDSPVSLLCRSLGAVPGFSLLTVCGQGYPTADRPRPHFHDLRVILTAHVSLIVGGK
ncbi:MAG: hypothetical protein U9Q79_02180, partial [Candidatus Hydrogenedentes bacterium]|nr:hypothetical protein [Candidatus Hydrogenedentota bacterium]